MDQSLLICRNNILRTVAQSWVRLVRNDHLKSHQLKKTTESFLLVAFLPIVSDIQNSMTTIEFTQGQRSYIRLRDN